jgi:hypothetical protein
MLTPSAYAPVLWVLSVLQPFVPKWVSGGLMVQPHLASLVLLALSGRPSLPLLVSSTRRLRVSARLQVQLGFVWFQYLRHFHLQLFVAVGLLGDLTLAVLRSQAGLKTTSSRSEGRWSLRSKGGTRDNLSPISTTVNRVAETVTVMISNCTFCG